MIVTSGEDGMGYLFQTKDLSSWRCFDSCFLQLCLQMVSHQGELYCTGVPAGLDSTTYLYRLVFNKEGLPVHWDEGVQFPRKTQVFDSMFSFNDSLIFPGSQNGQATFQDVLEFDTKQHRWLDQSWPFLPMGAAGLYPVVTGSAVHLMGGRLKWDGRVEPTREVVSINIADSGPSGIWHTTAVRELPFSASAAFFLLGHLIVFGGFISSNKPSIKECFAYNSVCKKWMAFPPLQQARCMPAVAVFNGHIIVAGGKEMGEWLSKIEALPLQVW